MKLPEFNLDGFKKITHIKIMNTDKEHSIQFIYQHSTDYQETTYDLTKELKKGLNFKKANLIAQNMLSILKFKNVPLKSIQILGDNTSSRLSLYNCIKTYIHEYAT